MRKTLIVLAGIALLALGAGLIAHRVMQSPNVAMLMPGGGAQWILLDGPIKYGALNRQPAVTCFRRSFDVSPNESTFTLTLQAMKVANVLINGQLVFDTGMDEERWKERRVVPLEILPGTHEIEILVQNETGPACLLAWCPELGLATGADWETSNDGKKWTGALTASSPRAADLARVLPRVDAAFVAKRPYLLLIFAVVFAATLLAQKCERIHAPSARTWRWIFIGAWVALAGNNLFKVPLAIGFDIEGHAAYINYIIDNGRLPLPTEGWTMFQAPLYYVLAAGWRALLLTLLRPETADYLVRLISLACGMAQIEIAYRAMRHAWPDREDLQVAGTLFAAFLPVNLYMSQYIGNEPMTGCLAGLVVLYCIKYIANPETGRNARAMAVMGALLGIAALTKMTALMLLPAVLAVAAFVWKDSDSGARRKITNIAGACALILGVAVLICGWYYLRNWVRLGRPFWGGWEAERTILWWQHPGYRTPDQFARFGLCLAYPVMAGVTSFWDGLYSTLWLDGFLSSMVNPDFLPPWHFGWMLCGAWLALPPMGAMAIGTVLGMVSRTPRLRSVTLFSAGVLALYLAALVYGFLNVPYYCITKASYTLGIVPCYAVLLTLGVSLCKTRWARAIAYGGLATWGIAAYCAYFVW